MTRLRLLPGTVALSGLFLAAGLTVAVPGVASPQVHATGTTASSARTIPTAKPGKSGIVYDLKAYAAAVKSKDWVYTPNGLAYKTCVYHAPAGATIDNGVIINRNGTRVRMKLCTHPTLAYPKTSTTRQATPSVITPASAWWADSWWNAPTWLNYLWERYSVPSNPSQSGALIFFFPSFEDSGGTTILQPVLTWGANPPIVTNPNIWYITSWYVWNYNKNYVTSNSVHVAPGNTIVGSIIATSCNPNGTCTWSVQAGVEGGSSVNPLTVTSGVSFTSVQGGVMEVPRATGCVQTPASGHEAFRNLSVSTHDGIVSPSFTNQIPNSQCSVHVQSSSTATDILWSP
jgi:hypothetical protein